MGQLIDDFLSDKCANSKPATYALYATYLNAFRASHAGLDANAITSSALRSWIDKRYGRGSSSSKRFAARAVLAVLHRAYVEHVIDRKPIRGFLKAADGRRERILTPAEYAKLVNATTRELRATVKFLWHTGVRPREFRLIEGGWVRGRTIVLPTEVAKTKRRIIYLDSMAANMIERLRGQRSGVLFRQPSGRPWTDHALTYRFRMLRRATGLKGLVPYTFRHTWITRLLERGVDRTTVAELARTSVRMIDDVYGHVDQNESRLLSMLD
jgi:integrase